VASSKAPAASGPTTSDSAKNARRVNSYGDFDGIRFIAKIGIEEGQGGYKDKNTLDLAITPDRKNWVKVEQVSQAGRRFSRSAPLRLRPMQATAGKPSWA
jgi:hypothetical protein